MPALGHPVELTPIAMLGLYLHIPFCSAICNYCNFNRGLFDADAEGAVRRRARRGDPSGRCTRRDGRHGQRRADTIYFGGGTPSLLEPDEVARIIDACRRAFDVAARRRGHARGESRDGRPSNASRRIARPASIDSASASSRFGTTSCGGCRGCTAPTRPRGAPRGARGRLRQRQPRPDDVAARPAASTSGSSRSTRRSRSGPSTCRSTCSRSIRMRR